MSGLSPVDGGLPTARCVICQRRDAAGPCARCRRPVCGDCCELSSGGATTFAVCLACVKRGGASLRSAWLGLVGWLALIIGALVAVGVVLMLLRR
ncbi:MAG: hypothetical protein AB7T06_14715 [Kofleriaceae bacterium]